jgi:hypothetical protein
MSKATQNHEGLASTTRTLLANCPLLGRQPKEGPILSHVGIEGDYEGREALCEIGDREQGSGG